MKAPKGKLLIIGGSEHKGIASDKPDIAELNPDFMKQEILKRILEEINGAETCIEVITTASASYPEEIASNYREAFGKLGCKHVGIMDMRYREEALNPDFVERLEKAGGVMFAGGDQLRLTTIMGGTPLLETICRRYHHDDFLIAGTSAGAMVMSNSMIAKGGGEEALLRGGLKISSGFGLLPGVIIDTHFITRGRFGRLAQAVSVNPTYIGIGLEEDTALLVTKGDAMETIGSGSVIIIDGHMIKCSNITEIEEGAPISVDSLLVHVMSRGDIYVLGERKFKKMTSNG